MKDLKKERIESERHADTCQPDKLRQKEAVEQDTVKHVKEQTEQKRRPEVKKPPDSKPPDRKPPDITPITMNCDADGILSSIQTFISFVVAVVCFCIYCFCFCYNAFDDKF